MEVDEEPIDSTDPVEDILPVHSPEAELKEVPAAGESGLPCPGRASSSIVVPQENGCDLNEGSQKDGLQSEQVDEAGAEGGPSFRGETLEPREMDTTPTVTPPSPKAALEMEERANVAEYLAPTPEGCVTPTALLSATGSPTQPRASPKRKQLSSPEGSEIADGLVSAVKRHCRSASETAPSSRLPGRMPYGPSYRADGEELEVAGGEEKQTPMLQRSEDSRTPLATTERTEHSPELSPREEPQAPMLQRSGDSSRTPPATPERTDHSPDLSPEEEPEDHLFVTPPEGDRPPGIVRDEFAGAEGDTSGDFPEQPEELAAPRGQVTPAETPAGTKPQPPAGPDAPDKDTPLPDGDEEWQPSEPEPVVASTWPSSPAAEGGDDSAVPPFQWSQPLNLSSDSCRNDFESPNGEVTRPYQRHLG